MLCVPSTVFAFSGPRISLGALTRLKHTDISLHRVFLSRAMRTTPHPPSPKTPPRPRLVLSFADSRRFRRKAPNPAPPRAQRAAPLGPGPALSSLILLSPRFPLLTLFSSRPPGPRGGPGVCVARTRWQRATHLCATQGGPPHSLSSAYRTGSICRRMSRRSASPRLYTSLSHGSSGPT